MPFRALIFDLDGTLLDSLADVADSMNSVLQERGFPPHPRDAYRLFVGEGIRRLVEKTLPPQSRSPEAVESCIQALKIRYRDSWTDQTRPYAGIPELLDGLSQKGILLNIFSNKPDEFVAVMVETLLDSGRFTCLLGVRPGVPRKPDPQGALSIARSCGLPPREFVFLGDTHVDMETAAAAGMFPVGALWGFRSREELKRSGARGLCRTPAELLDYFPDPAGVSHLEVK